MYIYIYIYVYIHTYMYKYSYPEIGHPEFCQPIEQRNLDPSNKNVALGQGVKITVGMFCV